MKVFHLTLPSRLFLQGHWGNMVMVKMVKGATAKNTRSFFGWRLFACGGNFV